MSWTQPICGDCYRKENPGREPVSVKSEYSKVEMCCKCGKLSKEGIYIRVNPATVRFPTYEDEG